MFHSVVQYRCVYMTICACSLCKYVQNRFVSCYLGLPCASPTLLLLNPDQLGEVTQSLAHIPGIRLPHNPPYTERGPVRRVPSTPFGARATPYYIDGEQPFLHVEALSPHAKHWQWAFDRRQISPEESTTQAIHGCDCWRSSWTQNPWQLTVCHPRSVDKRIRWR